MNNLKKQYTDTFNDIHSPDSIRHEVIRMSKKLNQNKELNNSNSVVETNQVEVSNDFNYHTIVTFAICIMLIISGTFGFNYFKKYNHSLIIGITSEDTTASNLETTVAVDDIISNSTVNNSSFKSIFNVDLAQLKYLFGNDGNSIIKYCNSNDDIIKVINTFDTSNWIESDIVISNDDEIRTRLYLNLSTTSSEYLDITFFYIPKYPTDSGYHGDNLYVHVINETKNIDKYYIINYTIFNNILDALEESNYFYFENNPTKNLYVKVGINEEVNITDNSIIKSISKNLFNNFTWHVISTDDAPNEENAETIFFEQSYNDVSYSVILFKHENSLYANVICLTFNQQYTFLYELTSYDITTDYQKLIHLIQLTDEDFSFLGVATKPFEKIKEINSYGENDSSSYHDISEEKFSKIIDVLNYNSWQEVPEEEYEYAKDNATDQICISGYNCYKNDECKETIHLTIYNNGYVEVISYKWLEGIKQEDFTRDGDGVLYEIYFNTSKCYKATIETYLSLLEMYPNEKPITTITYFAPIETLPPVTTETTITQN